MGGNRRSGKIGGNGLNAAGWLWPRRRDDKLQRNSKSLGG